MACKFWPSGARPLGCGPQRLDGVEDRLGEDGGGLFWLFVLVDGWLVVDPAGDLGRPHGVEIVGTDGGSEPVTPDVGDPLNDDVGDPGSSDVDEPGVEGGVSSEVAGQLGSGKMSALSRLSPLHAALAVATRRTSSTRLTPTKAAMSFPRRP